MKDKEIKQCMAGLLSKNAEACQAYELAVSAAQNENFKSFLNANANKRSTYATEIKSLLVSHGIEVPKSGSLSGSFQKALMQLKIALPGINDKVLLKECARTEARSLREYEDVLQRNDLPNEAASLLLKQRDGILATESALRDISRLLKSEQIQL